MARPRPAGGRPALGGHLVGQRVVVRRRLPGRSGPTGGPAMTDVLGILEAWGDGHAVVRRADGTTERIALAEIVAGKAIPEPPARPR